MSREKPIWYESDAVKDNIIAAGGKALRGVMSNYFSPNIYTGNVSLLNLKNYLMATIEAQDRRALIISDDFTQKYAKKVIEHLETIDMECKVWSGVKSEVPIPIIEEGVKVCEEFKPKVLIAIGGGSVMEATKIIMVKYEKPEENLLMLLPLGSLGLRKNDKISVF